MLSRENSGWRLPLVLSYGLLVVAIQFLPSANAAAPTLKLERDTDGAWIIRIADSGLTDAIVSVESAQMGMPPLLGTVKASGDDRIFRPRFPFQPGLTYRVVVETSPKTILKFSIPETTQAASTQVVAIYPSANVLPENHLKFYIHFSNSMARGDAYRWIRLLDERGQKVDVPFLELGEELWDPENKRLTLYFDPGRVKSDLLPGREMGAPLRAGRSYTLEVDSGWRDAQGLKLSAPFRKSFRVGAADRTLPDPKLWRIGSPQVASRQPITVVFPEPLDHALLHRMIEVLDLEGQKVVGRVEVDQGETRWRLTPTTEWKTGPYTLRADTALEDLAGNKLNRPFEFEGVRTQEQRASAPYIGIPFRTVFP